MAELVSMKEVARRLGMDRTHARRYVLRLGYRWRKMREKNGQLANALTEDEVVAVLEARQEEGFAFAREAREALEVIGVFYAIQLIPDLAPQRIKIGFATSLPDRLATHRTSAPTAQVMKSWPCRRTWERAAADAASATECKQVGPEVFDCARPDDLLARCEAFFGLMPKP